MPPQNIPITISKRGNHCEIDPAHVHADPNDTIVWTNDTSNNIVIFFPNPGAVFDDFSGDGSGKAHKEVANGQQHNRQVKGGPTLSPRGSHSHPYSVYCAATNSFAHGGSDGDVDV